MGTNGIETFGYLRLFVHLNIEAVGHLVILVNREEDNLTDKE